MRLGLVCLVSFSLCIHYILSRLPFIQLIRVTIFTQSSRPFSHSDISSRLEHSSVWVPATPPYTLTPCSFWCCRYTTSAITYETPHMIFRAISTARSHCSNLGSRAGPGDLISVFIIVPLFLPIPSPVITTYPPCRHSSYDLRYLN